MREGVEKVDFLGWNKSIVIMPHALTSVYRVLLSMLRKVIEVLVQLVSSVANQPDHLISF